MCCVIEGEETNTSADTVAVARLLPQIDSGPV